MEGVPFANGAPNLTVDVLAMLELSREREVTICGKDFKTGQTLIKTVLAPAFTLETFKHDRTDFSYPKRKSFQPEKTDLNHLNFL